MQTVILLLGIALFTHIAYGDVRRRRIPDALSVAIGALALLRLILAGDPYYALYSLVAAGAVFAVAFLLFWRGLFGGGDVKLVTAAALLVGYRDLLGFLFVMSLCGAVLALAIIAGDKLGPSLGKLGLRPLPGATIPGPQQTPARRSVPYGVAIAAAAVVILVLQSPVLQLSVPR